MCDLTWLTCTSLLKQQWQKSCPVVYMQAQKCITHGIANPEGWGFIITIQQSFFSSFQNSALAKIPCLKASAPLNRHRGFPVTERQIMIFAFHPWTYVINIYEKILYDLKVIYLTFFPSLVSHPSNIQVHVPFVTYLWCMATFYVIDYECLYL